VDFKKPITPVVTPQDLIKYLKDPNYSHEDIESTSPLKDGVSELQGQGLKLCFENNLANPVGHTLQKLP